MKLKYFLIFGIILISMNFISAVTNVTDCGKLNVSNTYYTLNQSITTTSSTCFTVTLGIASCPVLNVTLDCQGFNVTRTTLGGVAFNASTSCSTNQNASSPLTLINCTFINFTTGIIGNGTIGLTGTSKSVNGKTGGSGTTIFIYNTTLNSTIYTVAGTGGSAYLASGADGGNGGSSGDVYYYNSVLGTIYSDGGKGGTGAGQMSPPILGDGGAGGNGGYVYGENSSNGIIYNSGGQQGQGGTGVGGANGDAGNITLVNPISFNSFYSNGNVQPLLPQPGPLGKGGNITITNNSINISGLTISIAGSINGKLSLNFSDSFNDRNTVYSNIYLKMINSSSGIIDFLSNYITGSGLSNLSTKIIILNNSAYANSSVSALNKSANITLYNIPTLSNGVINSTLLSRCDSTTNPKCINFTNLNNGGTIVFNVTHFTGSPFSIVELVNCWSIIGSVTFIPTGCVKFTPTGQLR